MNKHAIREKYEFTNLRHLVEWAAKKYENKTAYSYCTDPHQGEIIKGSTAQLRKSKSVLWGVGKQHRVPLSLLTQGAQGQTAGQRLSAITKFASANSIFSLAVCFDRPRYRVFRYRNCPFMTANTCSALAHTDDF